MLWMNTVECCSALFTGMTSGHKNCCRLVIADGSSVHQAQVGLVLGTTLNTCFSSPVKWYLLRSEDIKPGITHIQADNQPSLWGLFEVDLLVLAGLSNRWSVVCGPMTSVQPQLNVDCSRRGHKLAAIRRQQTASIYSLLAMNWSLKQCWLVHNEQCLHGQRRGRLPSPLTVEVFYLMSPADVTFRAKLLVLRVLMFALWSPSYWRPLCSLVVAWWFQTI